MLSNMTPTFMVFFVVYWMFKELCKHRISSASKLFFIIGHPYSRADAVVTPLLMILVTVFSCQVLTSDQEQLGLHTHNVVLFLGTIAVSQAIRAFSVRTGQFKQFSPSYVNVVHVAILNFAGIVYVYFSAFSNSLYAETIGWVLLTLNAVRIFKYRAYDDFVAKNIDSDNAAFGNVYIVMIFDVVLRSLVGIILSFALACLLLMDSPNLGASNPDVFPFAITRPSDNLFLDLIYFAVVTLTSVGFGDITPVTSTARLVTSLFMLVGYVLFATIIGFAVSIASDIRKG